MAKLSFGLDIGVASVGYAVVDKETGKIIDKGVRLFDEADPKNNVDRREHRHIRRGIRRKEFRIYRTRRVLLEMGLINDISFLPLDNPYEIRSRGQKGKLSKEELATAILHLVKRNGFRYEVADDEDSGTKQIDEEFLCDHQLKQLEKNGKIRGIENKYHFSLYKKEFVSLLEKQNVAKEYCEKLLSIFEIRRDYSEGPGGPTSPTKYGRYLSFGAEPINLIEKMRGHCSIYEDELRAPKICPSAELFNFLNDLNNLTVNGNKINSEKKNDIIETYILGKGKITPKQLMDYLGVSSTYIDGFRLKNDKEILTEFKSLQKIKDICKKSNVNQYEINSIDDFKELDKLFEILTSTKIIEERVAKIKENCCESLKKYADIFAKISGVSEYHSLSLKAIYEICEEMLVESKNSQQVIVSFAKQDTTKQLKIPDDAIMSPVVKKSTNQALKIINALKKVYGLPDSILIEMPRENNSQDEKKAIEDANKKHLMAKEHVLEMLGSAGMKREDIKRDLIDKVLLYEEQDGKSIYSGKSINLQELVLRPDLFEIDHILPYSVSLDDSRTNKVLVYGSENQIKGKSTPKQAFAMKPEGWQSFAEFEASVRTNPKLKGKKASNLLFDKSLSDIETIEEFNNRALNDTRYACRLVLDTVKNYFSNRDENVKVFVINGKTTHMVRVMGNIQKDRNMFCHHAVDACIIASFSQSLYLSNALDNRLYDEETGEIYTIEDGKEIFGPIVDSVCKQLINFDPVKDYKFSYKVDTKPNRRICDETLYGTRIVDGELRAVKTYKNIYGPAGITLAQRIISDNKTDNLLIKKEDPKTYAFLMKIIDNYQNSNIKNPFEAYLNEHGYIYKVCKPGKKAPVIRNIRYIEDTINVHLDLSNKYAIKDKNKGYPVKLQLSPYRMDVYKNNSGVHKFVTIRYADVKDKNGKYFVNAEWYENEKIKLGIDKDFIFVNSFYRGDLIKRIFVDGTEKLDVFKTVNNPSSNAVELDFYGMSIEKQNKAGKKEKIRNMATISKSIMKIEKYGTDILGNMYLIKNEPLKLKWNKI